MSSTPNLDDLRQRVNHLKNLLDDPHPGLFTWVKAYSDAIKAIIEFWTREEKRLEIVD
jgi:hypothetical protein